METSFFSFFLSPTHTHPKLSNEQTMGAFANLLTHRHAEIAKVLVPTSIATGFLWTMASGKPLVDPYRWLSGACGVGGVTDGPALPGARSPSEDSGPPHGGDGAGEQGVPGVRERKSMMTQRLASSRRQPSVFRDRPRPTRSDLTCSPSQMHSITGEETVGEAGPAKTLLTLRR
jgi:hypothetical protein